MSPSNRTGRFRLSVLPITFLKSSNSLTGLLGGLYQVEIKNGLQLSFQISIVSILRDFSAKSDLTE